MIRHVYDQPRASGRRTGWGRLVAGVGDGRGARAFSGDYLRDGVQYELEEGAVVLEVAPCGSVKNGWEEATVYRVEQGELVSRGSWDWRAGFFECRDAVAAALAEPVAPAAPTPLQTVIEGCWSQIEALGVADRRYALDELLRRHADAILGGSAEESVAHRPLELDEE